MERIQIIEKSGSEAREETGTRHGIGLKNTGRRLWSKTGKTREGPAAERKAKTPSPQRPEVITGKKDRRSAKRNDRDELQNAM
jgi:hypothetical protein